MGRVRSHHALLQLVGVILEYGFGPMPSGAPTQAFAQSPIDRAAGGPRSHPFYVVNVSVLGKVPSDSTLRGKSFAVGLVYSSGLPSSLRNLGLPPPCCSECG